MEEELFRKSFPLFEELNPYGFVVKEDGYYYTKNILQDTFQIRVWIMSDGKVVGKVWDLDMDDEYHGYRMEKNLGEFSGRIRDEYIQTLMDIKNKCFFTKNFVSEQANRLSQKILELFGDSPSFEWDSNPDFGVFKNADSKKWYALIMHIDRDKIKAGEGFVDVLNVKLPEEDIPKLLLRKGFYPAYHMNKKYWISISLDEELTDEEIMAFIQISYQYTILKKK